MTSGWKKGTIKLAAANAIFANTPISFESVEFAGKVAGYKSTGPIAIEHAYLTNCVALVIEKLWNSLEA